MIVAFCIVAHVDLHVRVLSLLGRYWPCDGVRPGPQPTYSCTATHAISCVVCGRDVSRHIHNTYTYSCIHAHAHTVLCNCIQTVRLQAVVQSSLKVNVKRRRAPRTADVCTLSLNHDA